MPKLTFIKDRPPSLEEAQKLVGGYVQLVELPDGRQMLVDEDGIAKRLHVNIAASIIVGALSGVGPILGDAVILAGDARWLPDTISEGL